MTLELIDPARLLVKVPGGGGGGGSSGLHLPNAGETGFSHRCWALNPGSHAYMASPLSTKPSPSATIVVFK